MAGLIAYLRQGVRGLLRQPGFTAIAVLALAIGVGSATAMFSVVDTALVRPLPYLAPERQMRLASVNARGEQVPMGAAEFLHLAKHVTTLEALGVYFPHRATLTTPSGPRLSRVASLSASLFTTLGISPSRGRAFEPAEDLAGRAPVAIVSDAFWRREFAADPAVLGRTLQLDRKPVTIVGVLPAGATIPRLEKYEVFVPLAITPEQAALTAARSGYFGVARLKPSVSAAAAKAELDAILHGFNGYGIAIEPLLGWLTAEAAPALRAAFGGVLLLLLIACANVALLLLLRGTARGRDLAIRAALGGGRGRVIFQQVAEGLLLALAGGALGLVFAVFAVRAVVAFAPEGIPRLRELHVDVRMASFALVASLLAGAFAGAVSSWHSLRSDLFALLKDGGAAATPGGSRARVRDGLVVAQLAVALLLAAGAGLLVRSMERFAAIPLGLDPANVQTAFLYPQGPGFSSATEQLVTNARAIPGVEQAALVGYLPLHVARTWEDSIKVAGRNPTDTTPDIAALNWFTPGYLAASGMRLVKGRDLATSDGAGSAPVALVNQTFVNRFFAGREPIGELVRSYDWGETAFTVVGVVQDVRQWGPAVEPLPEMYLPKLQFAQNEEAYGTGAVLVMKSRLPAYALASALRAAGAPLSPQLQLGPPQPLDEYLDFHFRQRRFQLDLALAFAAAALVLSALGVYGAMAFSVAQRRRELAVRSALGAQARQIARLVLARGAWLALIGTCFGTAGALWLSRFLASMLYGVGERDPLTLTIAVATLALVTFAATLAPALKAARTDPMVALRSE